MECCRVHDMSPENTTVGLPPGWVDTDVCRLYIGINPPQPGGTRAPSKSPPVSWWSQWCTDSSVMILPGNWTCYVAKEAEPSCFNDTRNWRAAGSFPDRSVGKVWSIWDPKDFSERPCVKGIQSLSRLCDSPHFQSRHQHREETGLIQPNGQKQTDNITEETSRKDAVWQKQLTCGRTDTIESSPGEDVRDKRRWRSPFGSRVVFLQAAWPYRHQSPPTLSTCHVLAKNESSVKT